MATARSRPITSEALAVLEAEPRHFEWSDQAVVLARSLLEGDAND